MSGDKNELCRLAGQNAHQRRTEFLNHVVDSRNDDRDILVGECWLGRDGLGLIRPVADTVDQESEVAMNPWASQLTSSL